MCWEWFPEGTFFLLEQVDSQGVSGVRAAPLTLCWQCMNQCFLFRKFLGVLVVFRPANVSFWGCFPDYKPPFSEKHIF